MKEEKFLAAKYGSDALKYAGALYVIEALKKGRIITETIKWYDEVANKYNIKTGCVERSIRYFKGVLKDKRTNNDFINALILEYKSKK